MWHQLEGGELPSAGDAVSGTLDWERRHRLMRTHTALHVLCGVIWNEWGVPVTGGNMEPLSARMDFEFVGGTHVASTAEVGRVRIVKTESKGKGNKRVRLEVLDASERV